jgi:hypothetical protein
MSLKGDDWLDFSKKVSKHIESYTVPQYGDKGNEEADNYTVEDCLMQIKRYTVRNGKNSRPGQDELDLIKIAHYAQMAYTKLQEQQDAKS